MNKKIVFYFGEEFIMAAVRPFINKFYILKSANEDEHYLFFNIGKSDINYSSSLKAEAKNNKNIISDFYDGLEKNKKFSYNNFDYTYNHLFNIILDNIKNKYLEIFIKHKNFEKINIEICFSFHISEDKKYAVKKFFQNHDDFLLEKNSEKNFFEVLLFSENILKKWDKNQEKKFAIIEALSSDLHFSAIRINEKNKIDYNNKRTLKNYGEDRRIEVISTYVFEHLKSVSGMILREEDNKKIIENYKKQSLNWINELYKEKKAHTLISTKYHFNNYHIILEKKSIDEKLIGDLLFIESSFDDFLKKTFFKDILQYKKIIILGKNLNELEFKKILFQHRNYPEEKLIELNNNVLKGVLKKILEIESKKENVGEKDLEKDYEEVKKINFEHLKAGNILEISWHDRIARIIYEGRNHFRLSKIKNTGNLKIGDAFKINKIEVGKAISLEGVTRHGKKLGNYGSGANIVYVRIFKKN